MREVTDIQLYWADIHGERHLYPISPDDWMRQKDRIEAGETTPTEIAESLAAQIAAWEESGEREVHFIAADYVEVIASFGSGRDVVGFGDVRHHTRVQECAYSDVDFSGRIGKYAFRISAFDEDDVVPPQILLEVQMFGGWKAYFGSTVGEALRRLSVVIGEG